MKNITMSDKAAIYVIASLYIGLTVMCIVTDILLRSGRL